MEIYDHKEHKTTLHRLVCFLVGAWFVLVALVGLAYFNYVAFSSGLLPLILFMAFTDTTLVLLILDIITSD